MTDLAVPSREKYEHYIEGVMQYSFNTATGEDSVRYIHYDHLGSIDTITDDLGEVVSRLGFDPWGERTEADWSEGNPTMGAALFYDTQYGYTGHEMMDHLGLIHMGGRVYDPLVSRFLSADLFVQSPLDSQSYNRYSYVF